MKKTTTRYAVASATAALALVSLMGAGIEIGRAHV